MSQIANLPGEAETIAYANDLAFIIRARTEDDLENKANDYLELVNRWVEERYFRLASEKAVAVYLTGKKKTRVINVLLGETQVSIQKKARYLSVTLDTAISAREHIKHIAARAGKTALNLSRIPCIE